MTTFGTKRLPAQPDAIAPDGSDVRILLQLSRGSMAHFELDQEVDETPAVFVAHRTIEEIWYFVQGRGEMWRRQEDREAVVPIEPGVCLTIPCGTRFQFRSFGDEPLAAIGVTMPPWPGQGEAYGVEGKWEPTVGHR